MSLVGRNEITPWFRGNVNVPVIFAPMNAAETFGRGALVFIDAAGELAQFPFDGTQAIVADITGSGLIGGIACFGPGDFEATQGAGTSVDFRTGRTYATGATIGFWPWDAGIVFQTRNYISAAGTNVVPPGADVGMAWQMTGDNVSASALQGWSIETTAGVAATDVVARIHSILDIRRNPITAADTTTGDTVLFEITVK